MGKENQIVGMLGKRGVLKHGLIGVMLVVIMLSVLMAHYALSGDIESNVYDKVKVGNYIDTGLDKTKGISMDFVEKGLTHKVLEFEITSDISSQDIQLLIAENNFDANAGSLSKLSANSKEEPVYESICNPYDIKDPLNGSVNSVQNCTYVQKGTKTVEEEQWLPVELKSSEKSSADSLVSFNILGKGKYRYSFDTPIVNTGSGWGNAGTIFLNIDNTLYADKQHSSWWNETWQKKKLLNITSLSGSMGSNVTVRFTINTSSDDFRNDCNDLRIIYVGTEIDRFVSSCKSALTKVEFRLQDTFSGSNTEYYAYYDNPSALAPIVNQSNIYYGYDGGENQANGTLLINAGWGMLAGTSMEGYYSSSSAANGSRGIYVASEGSSANDAFYKNGSLTAISNGFLQAYLYDNGDTSLEYDLIYGGNNGNYPGLGIHKDQDEANKYQYMGDAGISDDGNRDYNKWHLMEIRVNDSKTYYFIDNNQIGTSNNYNTIFDFGISGKATDAKFDEFKLGISEDYSIILLDEEHPNIAPSTPSPIFSPEAAYTNTDLNCSSYINDSEGDNMVVFFNLTVNGELKASYILADQPNGSTPLWIIGSGNYSKSDEVKCHINLFDGELYSESNYTAIVISNSAPEIDSYNTSSLNRTLVYEDNATVNYQENETVRLAVEVSDADVEDSETLWYSWFVDSVFAELTQNSWFDQAWGWLSAGLHTVRVDVNDSSNAITTQAWNVTLANVVNKAWTVDYVPPTPDDEEVLDSATVNISVLVSPSVTGGLAPKALIDNLEADFNQGTYLNASYNISGVALNRTTVYSHQLFFDGFESGNLNNWAVTGTNPWAAIINGSYEGIYLAEAVQTISSTNITASVSTLGHTSVNVSYYRQLSFGSNDAFSVEWYDGSSWSYIEKVNDTNKADGSYVGQSLVLPASASNNPNFQLRFRCLTGAASEWCKVDNVKIKGTYTPFTSYGEFTSRLYNATEAVNWETISWDSNVPSGTELKFQVKACAVASCSGAVFAGPSGTSDTYYTTSGEALYPAKTQYIKYKAYFASNGSTTTILASVNVSGLTDAVYEDADVNNAWIDFNGGEYPMSGSGFSWSYVNNTLNVGDYSYTVYVNDTFGNVNMTGERTFSVPSYNITFNVTSGEDGSGLNNVQITCDYSGFDQEGDTTNTYGSYVFPVGSWSCEFELGGFFPKTQFFTADSDRDINIVLEEEKSLTTQEHDWLSALYNCIISKDCDAYNLLQTINTTTKKIWQQYLPTDENVVAQEDTLSNTLSPSSNITINYTLNIPYKEGYDNGDLLPIMVSFWFTDSNGKCYNQDKQTSSNRAESPYCIPLIAEYLGPNNGSVSFKVDLHPNLADGTYNIVRSIDIDPPVNGNPVWINYGRENIGTIDVRNPVQAAPKTIQAQPSTVQAKAPVIPRLQEITGNVIEGVKGTGAVPVLVGLGMMCLTMLGMSYLKSKHSSNHGENGKGGEAQK